MRKSFLITLTLLFALLSCKRIPLHDPTSDVFLKLDLRLNIDIQINADIDIEASPALKEKVYGKKPEMVRTCFYDPETHKLVSEDFLPPEGGFINLPTGVYDMILYSMGTKTTQITGTETRAGSYAFSSQTGSKLKVSTKADGDPQETIADQEVIYEPDHVFVARQQVVIPANASQESSTIVIESEARTLLETYTFEVINVNGAEHIQKADVYITGQASGKYLWDGRIRNKISALYLPVEINTDKGHIYTVFNTFGKFPGANNDVYLNVLVTTEGGGKYQWVFDVTDQFDNPDNVNHEIIINEDMVIPEPGTNADGFTPTVSDWGVEIIDVPIS